MTSRLIVAAATLSLFAASVAGAQPYPMPSPGAQPYRGAPQVHPGDRPPLGPGYNVAPGPNGCYRGEPFQSCRERLRAERRGHRHYVYRDGRYEDRDNRGAAVVAGVLGFILGAALAGSQEDRDYYESHRHNSGYLARCRATYRNFDVRTGTYLAPDGYRRYCTR